MRRPRRDDSNRFDITIVMFNRTSNAIPIAIVGLTVAAIGLSFWLTRERH